MMPDSSTSPASPPLHNDATNADSSAETAPASSATNSSATDLSAPLQDAARDDGDEPPLSVPDHAPELWEDGENNATLFLRAAFTLLAGWFLMWSQNRSTFSTGLEWNRWIWLSVVTNLLFPLFIIWMFFGQGLGHLAWLRDQRYNAWNYGWNWRHFKRHLLMALGMFVVMLPILWFASRDANTQTYYRSYFPPTSNALSWLYLFATLIVYMFCWEWFFRGFLLFGTAQGMGAIVAIVAQAILFGLAHGTKPGPEMYSSFAGGLILGIICWREKSFVPAFLTHTFIHLAWAPLVLR
jgi:membrane protease YdiL (CAAX protease family)